MFLDKCKLEILKSNKSYKLDKYYQIYILIIANLTI